MIVLAAADETPVNAIARELGITRPTVYLWRDRFRAAGIIGLLKDAPRPGRRPALSPDQVKAVMDPTLQTTPPDATQWSVRTMAKTRGFKGVPEEVWNFHIGGYQVCEKWLKDRQAKGGKNPAPAAC